MAVEITREEYTYQIENRVFIVTPVYKEKGEPASGYSTETDAG